VWRLPVAVLTMLALWTAGCAAPARADTIDHFALIMVWMPGLCQFEGDRPECKHLTLRRYDGQNLAFFALQALPGENGIPDAYCAAMPSDSEMDRGRQWCQMDKTGLRQDIAATLAEVMPIVRSCQDRGIWARYGTCSMYSPNQYFSDGIRLARQAAATQLNLKIAGAIGTRAEQDDLLAAFSGQFGEGSEKAIDFVCRTGPDKAAHLLQVKITLTLSAMNRGLGKAQLWKPRGTLRRHCPASFLVDAPPVSPTSQSPQTAAPARQNPAAAASEAPAAPAPMAKPKPGEPAAPERVPVEPVETAPLPAY
jgi:ribonuclease I